MLGFIRGKYACFLGVLEVCGVMGWMYEFADGLVSLDETKMRDKIKRKPDLKKKTFGMQMKRERSCFK